RPAGHGGGAIVVEMASRAPTLDEPFGLGLGEGDVLEALPDRNGVRATLHFAGGEAWIGLPLSKQTGSVELRFGAPESPLQSLEIPAPGQRVLLDGTQASRCRLLRGLAPPPG